MPRPREPATYGFHFGIDIACAEGTAVYATLTGHAELLPRHARSVIVVGAGGRSAHWHEYWHVLPAVRDGQPVVAYRTIIGHVVRGDVSSHLHFAEHGTAGYLNPLRSGALGPFTDRTAPTIRGLGLERGGKVLRTLPRSGRIDLVATALDTTPLPVASPWDDKPVTPALVLWRPRAAGTWRIAWDVRRELPTRDRFLTVYSRFTRQCSPYGRVGRFRFFIARGVEARTVARWRHVQVRVEDTRGNVVTKLLPVPEPA